MTQKRFKKLLMAHGYSAYLVRSLVEYIKAHRQRIEQGDDLVVLTNGTNIKIKRVRVYPYAETYKRILEGRDFLV